MSMWITMFYNHGLIIYKHLFLQEVDEKTESTRYGGREEIRAFLHSNAARDISKFIIRS